MKNNQRIIIVGGGSAGWMAAAALSNAFGTTKKIILIESDAIGTVGVGEATIPAVKSFNKLLGIDEAEFMRNTQGTFKLGIQFENWGAQGDVYMHPFGLVGKDSWMANFQHFWLKANRMGVAKSYFDYSLNIRTANSDKFFIDPNSGVDYAYHFDAGLYAAYLRKYSEVRGVVRIEGLIDTVQTHTDNGFIQSVTLNSGQTIEGDIFVDCSGFRALLIEHTLHTGFEDWSHWLPCDRAVAVQTESVSEPIPYTRSIAHQSGWQWRIPLQHRVGNGLVYCSRYLNDEDAKKLLLGNLDGATRTEPRLIKFRTGRAIKQWNKNCIAIGLSSGFLEPLESTSLHLIQTGIVRLIRMFPGDDINQSEVEEYNRQSQFEYERIRDFIILHYHVTQRTDSPFWNYCRTMSIPDTLARKVQVYKNTTSVFKEQDELFHEGSWQQVMLGQGITPRSYHPVVDKLSDDELVRLLKSIEKEHDQYLARFPSHQQFIDHYCKALAP
ncbi:tryptophan halogenase family protein [Cellvibrio fibrivorans]|uniref:Tryptophan halogenase n=1 Tax=Cellvibrio fibrivorans TaxID=126350 RepID=A0ABU1UTJ7_9GAMM|nr:tryptophan 7-halogenase [Cellvibrio fibrivorans]MDR7088495.1 tryptophan halogenase [Cellvibrio fibrivorans]